MTLPFKFVALGLWVLLAAMCASPPAEDAWGDGGGSGSGGDEHGFDGLDC